MKLKPRYKPTWSPNGNEKFLGHAGKIDVYFERGLEDPVLFVGPLERKLQQYTADNYDQFSYRDGALTYYVIDTTPDLHIELFEMCLAFQLLEQHGCLKEPE